MRGCPLAIQRAIQHALEGVNAHEHQGACAGKGGVGDQLARPPDPQVRRLRFAARMALQPMVPARLVRRSAAARRLRDAVVVDRPRLRRGLVHRHRLCPRQEAPPLQYPPGCSGPLPPQRSCQRLRSPCSRSRSPPTLSHSRLPRWSASRTPSYGSCGASCTRAPRRRSPFPISAPPSAWSRWCAR